MRWMFLVLLVVNLAFFMGGWYLDSQEKYEAVGDGSLSVSGGRAITLLSEVKAEQLQPRKGNSKPITQLQNEYKTGELCTQVGPFQARETAEQVVQRLSARMIRSEVKLLSIKTAPDYWVYIPPLPERSAAVRMLRELQARKIDSFVITEGELSNGISLGLFTYKDLGEKLLKDVIARGYKAQMKEAARYRDEFWVEVGREDRDLFGDDLWSEIRASYGFAGRYDNLCTEPVATVP